MPLHKWLRKCGVPNAGRSGWSHPDGSKWQNGMRGAGMWAPYRCRPRPWPGARGGLRRRRRPRRRHRLLQLLLVRPAHLVDFGNEAVLVGSEAGNKQENQQGRLAGPSPTPASDALQVLAYTA